MFLSIQPSWWQSYTTFILMNIGSGNGLVLSDKIFYWTGVPEAIAISHIPLKHVWNSNLIKSHLPITYLFFSYWHCYALCNISMWLVSLSMLCAKFQNNWVTERNWLFQNDWTTEMDVKDEGDFIWFEFMTSFRRVAYIITVPWLPDCGTWVTQGGNLQAMHVSRRNHKQHSEAHRSRHWIHLEKVNEVII